MQIVRKWPSNGRASTALTAATVINFLLLFWPVTPGLAQTADPNNNYCVNPLTTKPGGFTLGSNQICAGSPVIVTGSLPGLVNVNYNYSYSGKGLSDPGYTPQPVSSPYTKPGSYTIIQIGTGPGNVPVVACQVVQVVDVPDLLVGSSITCSGRTVILPIQNPSSLPYDGYAIDWKDGTPLDKVPSATVLSQSGQVSHTYKGSITSFFPEIYGYYNNATCKSPEIVRPALLQTTGNPPPGKPAVVSLKTNDDGTISINYQATGTDPIELQQKDPASGTYKSTGQTGTGGYFTIKTDTKQVQCFKVTTKTACGVSAESDEVCSLVLNVTAASKENNLSWQAYAGTTPFFRYRIYRNGTPSGTINNKNTTTGVDNGKIDCGVPYCYYLEATLRGQTETTVTSAPICVTGLNTDPAPALQNTFVSIENGVVRLQGTLPTASAPGQYTAIISRADGSGSPFQPIGTLTNSLVYLDNTANVKQQSYCYQVTYQTTCGLSSPATPPVCTILLNSKTPTGIDWTADTPFVPGNVANYILETLDTDNNTTTFLDLGGNTHFDPDLNDPKLQIYQYRIVAYNANGTPSYSNYYEVRQEPKLFVPNAFTPNGDGANDTFGVLGIFVDQFSLTIYNRWGEAIFHATDPANAWDGQTGGQPAPAGGYTYRVEIADQTGKRTAKSGPLLLIR